MQHCVCLCVHTCVWTFVSCMYVTSHSFKQEMGAQYLIVSKGMFNVGSVSGHMKGNYI